MAGRAADGLRRLLAPACGRWLAEPAGLQRASPGPASRSDESGGLLCVDAPAEALAGLAHPRAAVCLPWRSADAPVVERARAAGVGVFAHDHSTWVLLAFLHGVLGTPRRFLLTGTVIAFPEGAVAFTGASGSGKSRLALACVAAGAALVSDDAFQARFRNGAWEARPAPGFAGWLDRGGGELVDLRRSHGEQAVAAAATLTLELALDPAPAPSLPALPCARLPDSARNQPVTAIRHHLRQAAGYNEALHGG